MSEVRIFSTGLLRLATITAASALTGYGTTPVLDDTYNIADLQDIALPTSFQEKEMRAAPQLNTFVEARAFYGGKQEFSATVGELHKNLLLYFCGAAASNANKTFTIGKTSKPQFVHGEIVVQDNETSEEITYVAYRLSAPGLDTSFKLDDFVMPSFKGQCDPSRVTASLDKVLDIIYPA